MAIASSEQASRILREPVTEARALWEPAQAFLGKLLPAAEVAIESLSVGLSGLRSVDGQSSLFETRQEKRADALREVLEHLEKRCSAVRCASPRARSKRRAVRRAFFLHSRTSLAFESLPRKYLPRPLPVTHSLAIR